MEGALRLASHLILAEYAQSNYNLPAIRALALVVLCLKIGSHSLQKHPICPICYGGKSQNYAGVAKW